MADGGYLDSPSFAARLSSMNAGGMQGAGGEGGRGPLQMELGAGQLNKMVVNNLAEGSTVAAIIKSTLGVKGLDKCFSFMSNTTAGLGAGFSLSNVGLGGSILNATPKSIIGGGKERG